MLGKTSNPLTTSQLTSPAGVGEISLALGFAASTALRIAGQLYREEVGVSETERGGCTDARSNRAIRVEARPTHFAAASVAGMATDTPETVWSVTVSRLTPSVRDNWAWNRLCTVYVIFGASLECSGRELTGLVVAHGH